MPENREHVEELQQLYAQASKEMDTIRECIAFYQTQRSVLKELQEKEDTSRLVQGKEEKMWELQDL
jgi:hypothetical protein